MELAIRKEREDRFRSLKRRIIAVDTETTGTRPWHGDKPFAISFCDYEGNTAYFQWMVDPFTRNVIPNPDDLEIVKRLMEDESVEKVFHNALFDVQMLEVAYGIRTLGHIHDTMFAAHVCYNLENNYKLKDLSEKYLGYPKEDQDLLGKRVQLIRRRINEVQELHRKRELKKKSTLTELRLSLMDKRKWNLLSKEYNLPSNVIQDACVKGIKLSPHYEADYWLPQYLDPENNLCEIYAVGDVERTMLLWQMYEPMISDDSHYKETYEREKRLFYITYQMEKKGCLIDIDKTKELNEVYESQRVSALATLRKPEYGGKDFNPNSYIQCVNLFFNKLNLPIHNRTPSGSPKVDNTWIIRNKDNPAVFALMQYRNSVKAKSSFFDVYLEEGTYCKESNKYPNLRCLHPDFQQMGPRTGRYSCRKPSLMTVADPKTGQNFISPILAKVPFIPRPSYRWYGFDYSQLEVKIYAEVSQDPILLDGIKHGRNIHSEVTNRAWGGEGNPAAVRAMVEALEFMNRSPASSPEIQEIWDEFNWNRVKGTKEQAEIIATLYLKRYNWDIVEAEHSIGKEISRKKAKQMTFAKIYGGGPKAIMDILRCSLYEAKLFLDDYDRGMPRLNEYMQELSKKARHDGYIINSFGRKLFIDPFEVYKCVNYMVQGSAADLLKIKMIEVDDYIRETGLDATILINLHDEMIIEVKQEHSYKWFLRRIKHIMEDSGGVFNIPLTVDLERVSENWSEKLAVNL